MSRCFPFPPPGYERRHRPEDLDLLKESKRKEKKHKKEKKDKERKKDKEKEKDGSDERHKEKKERKGKNKDKKEKHRDKKKDKEDRGKDKDKSSISEESVVAGKFEATSAGKLPQRVNTKDIGSSFNEGKSSALFQGQNGGKTSQSSLSSQANEESKFVQELSRRFRDEEKGTQSQLPEKVAVLARKDQEIVGRAAARKFSGQLIEEKGDDKNKRFERKVDPQGLRNEFSGNILVQDLVPMTKNKVGGIPKTVDEQDSRRLGQKEKYKEISAIERGNKQKDKVKESPAKEEDNEKVEKKDDKVKIKNENKKSCQNHLKDDERNDLGSFTCNRSTGLLKDTNSNPAIEGSIKKRKDMRTNGFLHESEIRPNKLQRPDPHQSTDNGRKPEPFQTPTKSPHDKHVVPSNVRVDSKDMLMNGIIEPQKPSPLKPKPSAVTVVNNQTEASKIPHHDSNCMNKVLKVQKIEDLIAEASRRPPHPDSKYLAKILAVPNMDNGSENDDQEWLLSKRGPSNKPTMESIVVKDDLHVWSEAVYIESADVCALPYVIPY